MTSPSKIFDELNEAFTKGDMEAALNLWTEDCVIREAPDLPFGGDWKGRDGVVALMAKMSESFKMVPTLLGIYDIDETHFITHVSMDLTSIETGITKTIPVLEIYTLRDGKILEAMPFYWNAGSLSV